MTRLRPSPAATRTPVRSVAGAALRALRPTVLGAAVAVAVVLGVSAGPARADVAADLREATLAIGEGRYADARVRVERALEERPDNALGRFLKAVVQSETGQAGDAELLYRTLIDEYPEFPEPRNNLAVLLARRGDLDGARAQLEAAVRAAPTYALAAENLGDLYVQLAVRAYRRAVSAGSTPAKGASAIVPAPGALGIEPRPAAAPGALSPGSPPGVLGAKLRRAEDMAGALRTDGSPRPPAK